MSKTGTGRSAASTAWAAPELPRHGEPRPRDEDMASWMGRASVRCVTDSTTQARNDASMDMAWTRPPRSDRWASSSKSCVGTTATGQKYKPTLRPDMCEDPVLEEGLHAVRAEVQRLGLPRSTRMMASTPRDRTPKTSTTATKSHPRSSSSSSIRKAPTNWRPPASQKSRTRTSSTSEPQAILHERRAHA